MSAQACNVPADAAEGAAGEAATGVLASGAKGEASAPAFTAGIGVDGGESVATPGRGIGRSAVPTAGEGVGVESGAAGGKSGTIAADQGCRSLKMTWQGPGCCSAGAPGTGRS